MKRNTRRHLTTLAIAIALVALIELTEYFMGATVPAPIGYTSLSFDLLRSWDYVEGKTPIPGEIQTFDGRHVQMTGFMVPLTQARAITDFVLIPYLWGCCYGAPPAPNHMVVVHMTGDKTASYVPKPIYVRGTFHCGETRENGTLISLYRIEADGIVGPH